MLVGLKRSRTVILGLGLLMALVLIPESRGASAQETLRILFIGNSYTAVAKASLIETVGLQEAHPLEFGFITPGGMTLARHLSNPQVTDQIRNGHWDYVVLQDQSQTPALPEGHGQSFQDAVDGFTELIRAAGAEPILFETWGRRDGDAMNPEFFPDYETMQAKLTEAYHEAGARNAIRVAPVGEVWASVRRMNPRLGLALYGADGSHQSSAGARLATAVLLETILGRPVRLPGCPDSILERDCGTIDVELRRVLDASPAAAAR